MNPQYTNVKVEGPSFPTKGQPVLVTQHPFGVFLSTSDLQKKKDFLSKGLRATTGASFEESMVQLGTLLQKGGECFFLSNATAGSNSYHRLPVLIKFYGSILAGSSLSHDSNTAFPYKKSYGIKGILAAPPQSYPPQE